MQGEQEHGEIRQFPSATFPTLQAAVDACNEGDCVYISPGEHALDAPLRITKKIFLMGFTDADGTLVTLRYNGGALRPAVPMLRVDSADVTVSHLSIVMTHDAERATGAASCSNVAIDVSEGGMLRLNHCKCDASVVTIMVRRGATMSLSNTTVSSSTIGVRCDGEVHAENISFVDCPTAVDIGDAASVSIENCTFRGRGVGIADNGHATLKVSGTKFIGSDIGVLFDFETSSPKPPTIKACEFSGCDRGVSVSGAECNPVVAKNTFTRCGESAVCVLGGVPLVTGNTVSRGLKFGLELLGGRAHVSGNVVSACADGGIVISGGTAMPEVVGNELVAHCCAETAGLTASLSHAAKAMAGAGDDAAQHEAALPVGVSIGIVIEEGAAPRIDGNTLCDNDVNVWVTDACGVIINNSFDTSRRDNVIVWGPQTDAVLSVNDINGSARATGVSVMHGARCEISRNVIRAAKLAGVCLRGSGKTVIEANEIDDCQDAVVVMGGSVGTALRNQTPLPIEVFSDSTATFVRA
jgi:hypothetical protein